MIGGSYGGQIQYAVAALDSRIDAIVPIITWNDLSYSLAPNNTDLSSGVTSARPAWPRRSGSTSSSAPASPPARRTLTIDPETMAGCPNFVDQACPAAAQLNTAGYPDAATLALARHASVSTYLKKVKRPDPARAGPEGHPVQPPGGRRDVPVAAGAGHPGQDGLAVLGPLRLRPGAR